MSVTEIGLREACGVFGCVAAGHWPTDLHVAQIIALGLTGLQHRGQESAGIVTSCGEDAYQIEQFKGMGLVGQVLKEENLMKLKGNLGIGHTRYSTSGSSEVLNCQPFVVETLHGRIATAHNGELVNANPLKQKILQHGTGLTTGSDSELITQLLALSPPEGEPNGPDWMARIKQLMNYTQIAYSLLVQYKDAIYAVRDPYGNRPLCIGQLHAVLDDTGTSDNSDCEGWVISSESCSFQLIGATYFREVIPGEIVKVTREGIKSLCIVPRQQEVPSSFCIFEYIYFARADSIIEGQMVYSVRKRCGQQLAIEANVNADLVSTVPESATPAALGYSKVSGLPYVEVLCKNRYIGRTFIQPSARLRQLAVAKKFGALTDNFKGLKIVLVDDSIVRGNTMGPIVRLLKSSGAREVHIRVASPPLKYPCYMGINIPTQDELIANKMNCNDLAKHLGSSRMDMSSLSEELFKLSMSRIGTLPDTNWVMVAMTFPGGADSVAYLTVEGLIEAVHGGLEEHNKDSGLCTACLTGKYPVALEW